MPTTTVTPTIFKWTDDPLYATGGFNMTFLQLKDVFKKILVTGMGSKPALGWTLQFDDSNGIVFRNPSDTFSFGIRQGSGTGTTFDGWSEWYFAEDFIDSTTYSNDFYGGCFGDSWDSSTRNHHFLAIGYQDTFIFSSTARTGGQYFNISYIESLLYQSVMCLKYETYNNDSKPYFFWGTASERKDIGAGIYKNPPIYSTSISYHGVYIRNPNIWASEYDNGHMVKPFNRDGSIYTNYASIAVVRNFGFDNRQDNFEEPWQTIVDKSFFLPFLVTTRRGKDGSHDFSADTYFYGVVPYLKQGLEINRYDPPPSKGYGDTLTIGGNDYFYARTSISSFYIHAGDWEYPT